MSNVTYRTPDTTPAGGPSPSIWADCPVLEIIRDPGKGIHIFEDFDGGVITDGVSQSRFSLVGGNADCSAPTDELSGVLEIEGGNTADDEASLVTNVLYSLLKNSRKKFWLEAKLKFEDTDDDSCFMFGLGEALILAADQMTDDNSGSSTITDYDFLGFYAGSGGTYMDSINSVYHEVGDGGTPTEIEADVVALTDGSAALDDTYIQLGMSFDGEETVTFYVDGVEQATKLDLDTLTTTAGGFTLPLGVTLGYKNLAGTESFVAVDWIRFACEK